MKVLVVGGSGRVGRGAIWDLVNSKDVSKVVLADVRLDEAQRYAERVGSNKLTAEHVDLRDSQRLVEMIRKFDVVANAVWFEHVLTVTKAAIEAKRHCCDVGGLYYVSLKQLELDGLAKKAGVTVIIGLGASPGITNVLARYGADKLDKIETIRIRGGGHAAKPGTKVSGVPMTLRTHFEELTSSPMVYQDGEMKQVPPLSGKEKVLFPEPLGEREVFLTLHSEVATLARFRGVKNVDVKIPFSPESREQARILEDLGLIDSKPIRIGNTEIEPRKVLLEMLLSRPDEREELQGKGITANQVAIIGQQDGEVVQYTYALIVEQDFEWGNQKTGIPLSIGCQMLAKGDIKEKGVIPPEICIDPEQFLAELKKRKGFKLIEEYKRIRML